MYMVNVIICRLAFALLQLFQSVDFRCFKEPFITNDRQRGADRNISEVFLVWQRTLSQNAKFVLLCNHWGYQKVTLWGHPQYVCWHFFGH